jgi:hypothetical protein
MDRDTNNRGRAGTCATCGRENPSGSARWCGGCGAEISAATGASTRARISPIEPSSDPASDAEPVMGTTAGRPRARGPRALALSLLLIAALVVGAVVSAPGRDRVDDDAGEVELPRSEALPIPTDPPGPDADEARDRPVEGLEPVREIAPGAVVWADQVTNEPLSPTADLEVADGLIITAERSPGETEDELAADVVAVDATTGEQVWMRTVTAPWFPPTAPGLAVAGRWAVVADCAQLTGVDLTDGEVVWQHRSERQILLNDVAPAPRDDPEVVLVVTSNRISPRLDWVVSAVDVVTGEIRWDREVFRAAVTPDAAVVLEEDGRLIGLSATTGEPLWETTPDTSSSDLFSVGGAILETDDRAGTRGWLRAAADGRLLFDDEVHRHGLPMPGRADVERQVELVTTVDEVALVEDGKVRWSVPQPDAACCVGSHVPAGEQAVAVLLAEGTLLRLDRRDGEVLSDRNVRGVQATNTTLAGRFVLAADEPIRDRAMPLRLTDTSDPAGWRVVATLTEGQVVAVLPEGDVLLLADDRVHRVTSP